MSALVTQEQAFLTRKPLGQLMVDQGIIEQSALDAALIEQEFSGDRLGKILVRNGLITRRQLIKLLYKENNLEVLDEPFETDRIPHELLYKFRIMVLADINKTLILATDGVRVVAEKKIREIPHYKDYQFNWIGYDPVVFEKHMKQIDKYIHSDDLETILRNSVIKNASDIHLVPKDQSYTMFYRILGVRRIIKEIPIEKAKKYIAQAKINANITISDRQRLHEGAFQLTLLDRKVDFRLSVIPEVKGEKMVLRVLDPESAFPKLEALGLRNVDVWRGAYQKPNGLCLICGPTGSGKSTTMNATLRDMDRFALSIQSIEDPAEFELSYIGQMNVNRSMGVDFSQALRSFMRADPDVILIGEIRDIETARLAIRAAETGHLVLATLHASDIHASIARMIDLGVPFNDFAHLLRSVMAQRLIRTLCVECHGSGCSECEQGGYGGRTMVSEVHAFEDSEEVYRVYQGERPYQSIIKDAENRLLEGMTDQAEIKRIFGLK